MRLVEDIFVLLASKLRFLLVGLLKVVKVLEEQNPRSLLGIVKLSSATGLWDLFLWKGAVPLFVELKRHKLDRISTSQLRWTSS